MSFRTKNGIFGTNNWEENPCGIFGVSGIFLVSWVSSVMKNDIFWFLDQCTGMMLVSFGTSREPAGASPSLEGLGIFLNRL